MYLAGDQVALCTTNFTLKFKWRSNELVYFNWTQVLAGAIVGACYPTLARYRIKRHFCFRVL